MCSPATCRKCSKTTWAGCGAHVEQVMRGVPQSQRCDCRDEQAHRPGSMLSRLFGR